VNRRLIDAIDGLDGVTINDLYAHYPNFHIDVAREQALLRQHDLIVFQHPFYWYSSPAILKQWQDLVLEHGFAYGQGGTALQGKAFLSAISTGGPAEAYGAQGSNHFSMLELLSALRDGSIDRERLRQLPIIQRNLASLLPSPESAGHAR
jgi:glutathione-regulated potassium-efflux system ancillary protein KefG